LTEELMKKLNEILANENISNDPKIIEEYSHDLSFSKSVKPKAVVWLTESEDIPKQDSRKGRVEMGSRVANRYCTASKCRKNH